MWRVTLDDLHVLGACDEGLRWFYDQFGDELLTAWTPAACAELLEDHSPSWEFLEWAVRTGAIPDLPSGC